MTESSWPPQSLNILWAALVVEQIDSLSVGVEALE